MPLFWKKFPKYYILFQNFGKILSTWLDYIQFYKNVEVTILVTKFFDLIQQDLLEHRLNYDNAVKKQFIPL